MYPIRIGMKTQVEINRKKFIMHILEGNKFDLNQPGYIYQCDSNSSSIVMGFDKESIYTELLHDIEFCPYSISIVDKLFVMIFGLGKSDVYLSKNL
ncbi:hypothetical protein C1645_827774 [Glomus cerebriforme]|uniref:Uncharacterized protein n=1 Tax=Glomus cerebriforme TaxID=658196 RepID=A0A397SN52_9GLOM|nr:hypothetical protein C1645_827774 [Glomus cerebriforme]